MKKIALVTGGSRGIGYAISEMLAKNGCVVAIADINEEIGNTAVEKIQENGGEAKFYKFDVTNTEAVKSSLKEIVNEFGAIDYLVNNAGVTRDQLLLRMKDEDWDFVLDVNLKGTFIVSREWAKIMSRKKTGSIVNIASVVGRIGNVSQANYSASKGGVIAMTKTFAKELGGRNIRVNAIAPGFIETDMTRDLREDAKQYFLDQILLKRPGKPNDVAQLVYFLLSDNASYITGQTINIDGGMVLS